MRSIVGWTLAGVVADALKRSGEYDGPSLLNALEQTDLDVKGAIPGSRWAYSGHLARANAQVRLLPGPQRPDREGLRAHRSAVALRQLPCCSSPMSKCATRAPSSALQGLSLNVPEGHIVALLGANGAGKSTTLKAISGLLKSDGGQVADGSVIELDGQSLEGLDPADIVRLGTFHVMEGRRVFQHLSVEDNLRAGAHTRGRQTFAQDLEQVYGYFPRLQERGRGAAGYLSGGEQQMLAIGRALMARPRLILLDEPSLGLAPLVVREIFGIDPAHQPRVRHQRVARRAERAGRAAGGQLRLRAGEWPGRPGGLRRHAARQRARPGFVPRTRRAVGGMSLLIDDVQLRFGGVVALDGVSLAVHAGEIAAIIGPNGAGKTSLLNSISGLYVPQRGRIEWEATSILGRKPHHIARLGIARTFQNLGLFASLSVLDNLLLGRHVHLRSGRPRIGCLLGQRRSARKRRIAASSRTFSSLWSWDTSLRLRRPARWPMDSRNGSSSAGRSRNRLDCCCWTSRWLA